MTRNLKILGVALAAAFALSAVAASAASAQIGKVTSDGPVTLTGVETGAEGANSFSAFGITTECDETTYAGHKIATTPHEFVPSGATEVTITPTYLGCHKTNGEAMTFDMNGCDYVLRDATTTGGVEGTYGVVTDLVCGGGGAIKITTTPCNIETPAQTGMTGLHLTNTPASDDVDLTGEITTIHAKTCLGLETNSAVRKFDVTITGHNELAESTPVTITDEG